MNPSQPPFGELQTLDKYLHRVLCNNPSPFTLHGTWTHIVGDLHDRSKLLAVVDPGPADAKHIATILELVPAERISHILITHTHNDHSPGTRLLQAHCEAKSYALGPHGMGRQLAEDDFIVGADGDFTPDVTLQDGEIIKGDGWTLECIHTPGHASNHACFANPSEDWILVGDHVMAWSSTIISPPDGHLGDFLASLDTLQSRQERILCPAHGDIIEDKNTRLEQLRQHRLERIEQTLTHLGHIPQSLETLTARIYHDTPKAMWPAAARSLKATLNYLQESRRAGYRDTASDAGWYAIDN